MEHAIGKAMQRTSIEVNAVDPLQQAIAGAIVLDDGRGQGHLVLDGELADTDDEAEADRELIGYDED